jgi:hypothetical protein
MIYVEDLMVAKVAGKMVAKVAVKMVAKVVACMTMIFRLQMMLHVLGYNLIICAFIILYLNKYLTKLLNNFK